LNDFGARVKPLAMTMRRCLGLCSCVAVAIATGCSKKAAPPPKEAAPATTAAKVDAGPPPVVGMDDPFVRLTGDVAKSLKAGYKAMQAKKYDEARTAFAAVVSAVPDYSPARMQEVKAAALGGHAADVPELWKALLARDYVAYAGRLDKPKEFAPLRAGPEWDRIKAQEANVRTAYAADLAKGLFFVGRSRELGISKGGEGTAKLALNQEVYQVDAAAKRYRRLTETEGRVFAYSVAPENKAISFLMVTTIADATGPMPEFVDASVGSIDLATLETTGPLRLGPAGTRATAVVMGWTAQGDPVWTLRAGDAAETFYTLDATRTATVTVLASGAVTSHRTTAAPSSVSTVSMPADRSRWRTIDAACRSSTRTARCARRACWIRTRWCGRRRAAASPTPARSTSASRAAARTRTSSSRGSAARRPRRASRPRRRCSAWRGSTTIVSSTRPGPASSRRSTCWTSRPRRTRF